jgi:capsular exopolysaccharide synthesis family protein
MSTERTDIERVSPSAEQIELQDRDYARYQGLQYAEPYVDMFEDQHEAANWSSKLGVVWRAFKKRKWLIIAVTLLVTMGVAAEVSRYRRNYTSSVLLEIRKETNSFLATAPDADPENIVNINTKILMIQSRPLVEDVVRKLGLTEEKRFLDVSNKRSWSQTATSILIRLGLADRSEPDEGLPAIQSGSAGRVKNPTAPLATTPDAEPMESLPDIPKSDASLDRYVAVLQSGLEVSHPRDTQALRISFSHTHPEIAALVANGVAQCFIQRHFKKKTESVNNTSTWLERSTADLKSKMAQAEQALADYTRDHKILPNQGQSLAGNMLLKLHDQLARAETELLLKQSLFDEVNAGRGDRLPEAFSDSKTLELQKHLDEVALTEAQLSASYGPENPKLVEIRRTKALLEQQLADSKIAFQEKVKGDYQRAVRDRAAIAAALERAQAAAAEQDQSAVQYNILKDEAATASGLYKDFLQKTKQASLEVAQQHNNISVIQPALVPKSPDGPTYGVAVLLAFLGSLAGSIGVAVLIEQFDNTIKGVNDVNRYVKLPTLGVIPSIPADPGLLAESNGTKRKGRLSLKAYESQKGAESAGIVKYTSLLTSGGWTPPQNADVAKFTSPNGKYLAAEAYRALRTSVLLSTESRPKTLLFTSSQPGEGKTTTLLNTATCFAQLGGEVLIIDCDLRKPYGKSGLSGRGAIGLSSLLYGTAGIDRAVYKLQTPQLSLLPRGPACPNPAELISSERMKELLRTLSEHYDHILIDSPPLLCATDSVILSTLVDAVLMVVRVGKSTREAVHQSRAMLTAVGANLVGVVLNDIDLRHATNSDFAYYTYSADGKNRTIDGASDILLT